MDSKKYELQATLKFKERWVDVIAFISPTILTLNSKESYYWEALQLVNYINFNIKSYGRYYIDSYGDIAYSLRFSYNALEKMPEKFTKEVEAAIDYYSDLFIDLVDVCQGKTSFEDTKEVIDEMWN